MYEQSASVYDVIYAEKDYAAESRRLGLLLREGRRPPGRRLLEAACGTGRYLEHLRGRWDVEGFDIAPSMLAAARARLPGVPLHQADFRTVDLGRTFDVVVCLFSSIGYVRGLRELRRAVRRLAAHLAPGGILVLEPWFGPDAYRPRTVHSTISQGDELHVARMVTSQRRGRASVLDMHHLVGTPSGTRHFVEHHELWLFTADEYRDALERAGLEVTYDVKGLSDRGLWFGRRPVRASHDDGFHGGAQRP